MKWLESERDDDLAMICEECDLPVWVCGAVAFEAKRRGGIKARRREVEAEAREWWRGQSAEGEAKE